MARAFAGNQNISNTSADQLSGIDNAAQAVMAWVYNAGVSADEWICGSITNTSGAGRRRFLLSPPGASGFVVSYQVPSTSLTTFKSSTDITASAWHSVVLSFDASNGNMTGGVVPDFWVDGVADTMTKAAGSGNRTTGDNRFKWGESHNNAVDYSGSVGPTAVVNGTVTADDANRFHWWGAAPGGPSTMLIWMPFHTTKLDNAGTAALTFTNSNSTMTTLPKIERCWAATMGCGR